MKCKTCKEPMEWIGGMWFCEDCTEVPDEDEMYRHGR